MRECSPFVRALLLLLLWHLAPGRAQAAPPEKLPPGMGEYIMVLWPGGSPIPGGTGTIKSVPEPDVEQRGGKVLSKDANRRLILLPLAAASELRRHEAVAYLQRVWRGESLEGWNESYTPPPASVMRLHAGPSADTNLHWGPKSYSYDGSGNIKQIGDDHYTYDTAGRLIQATVNGKTESYQYDSFGNLTQKGVDGGNPVVIPIDGASNRMVGMTYDAAGNVTSADEGRRTYKYDSFDMLTRVKSNNIGERRMIYDANDERIGMLMVNDPLSRWTIRDFEGRVIREYKADSFEAWTWEEDNFYGESALVGGETQGWGYTAEYRYGGQRHYHLDHLGSVRMVTDDHSPGRSISEHEYYPFGATMTRTYQEQMNWSDPHIDSMRFAGHWRDFLGVLNVDNTEYLDNMHARTYDPNLGRFLSVDPTLDVDEALHAPQAWNRYPYTRNNPIRYTDPDGRDLYDYIEGVGNGWSSSNLLNLNRVKARNEDYAAGQAVGDALAVTSGVYEMFSGVTGAAGSTILTALSGGSTAPVTAPAAAISATVAIHGAITTGRAALNVANDSVHMSSSVNQMNKEVKAGKAPSEVKRVDAGKVKGEQDHVHFNDKNKSALNRNGTWKHGAAKLTRKTLEWLGGHGWTLPK
jgi:RHS repeat-associated protein